MPYIKGDPWVICDTCGFKVRMSQTKKTWDNLRVCRKDWEPKHPQLSVRGRVDKQAVYDGRPEAADYFLDTNEVTAEKLQEWVTDWFGQIFGGKKS